MSDDKRPDLHHSQGVMVAEVLGGVDPDVAIKEEAAAIAESEQTDAFSDAVRIWMALITERERLDEMIRTRRNGNVVLDDAAIADITRTRARVAELVDIVMERRHKVGEVVAGKPLTKEERAAKVAEEFKLVGVDYHYERKSTPNCGVCLDGAAPCPVIDPPNTHWTCLACGKFVGPKEKP